MRLTRLISRSVGETEAHAADLARTLAAGSVITLSGDLGAGKTQFVRGLVTGLGGDGRQVSSPTYVLLNVYDTLRIAVYHLDAYRVSGEADLEAIGFDELLGAGGVTVVEWSQRVPALIPLHAIHVTLETTGDTDRTIDIRLP